MRKYLIVLLTLAIITSMLCACGGGSSNVPEPTNSYIALVVDENNAPVAGVGVQLCSDKMCFMEETNSEGIAEFQVDEGEYTLHVLKVPDGFAEDSTEYEVPQKFSVVNIVLKKAE